MGWTILETSYSPQGVKSWRRWIVSFSTFRIFKKCACCIFLYLFYAACETLGAIVLDLLYLSILLTPCQNGKEESQRKGYIVKSLLICCFDLWLSCSKHYTPLFSLSISRARCFFKIWTADIFFCWLDGTFKCYRPCLISLTFVPQTASEILGPKKLLKSISSGYQCSFDHLFQLRNLP